MPFWWTGECVCPCVCCVRVCGCVCTYACVPTCVWVGFEDEQGQGDRIFGGRAVSWDDYINFYNYFNSEICLFNNDFISSIKSLLKLSG